MDTTRLNLVPQGVLVVWEWEWQDDDSDGEHMSESSAEDLGHSHHNPHIQSDTQSSESEQELEFQLPSQTHTMTLKCIGTTHNFNAQEVLRKVSTLLEQGEQVPVKIVPELDNQRSHSNANLRASSTNLDTLLEKLSTMYTERWSRSKFAWAKYLVVWICSGPGYYAGINIALNGEWSCEVCRCASTR